MQMNNMETSWNYFGVSTDWLDSSLCKQGKESESSMPQVGEHRLLRQSPTVAFRVFMAFRVISVLLSCSCQFPFSPTLYPCGCQHTATCLAISSFSFGLSQSWKEEGRGEVVLVVVSMPPSPLVPAAGVPRRCPRSWMSGRRTSPGFRMEQAGTWRWPPPVRIRG